MQPWGGPYPPKRHERTANPGLNSRSTWPLAAGLSHAFTLEGAALAGLGCLPQLASLDLLVDKVAMQGRRYSARGRQYNLGSPCCCLPHSLLPLQVASPPQPQHNHLLASFVPPPAPARRWAAARRTWRRRCRASHASACGAAWSLQPLPQSYWRACLRWVSTGASWCASHSYMPEGSRCCVVDRRRLTRPHPQPQ